MPLPTCQSCQSQWSWKDTEKAMIHFKRAMKCPHCGATQYQTQKSQWRTSMIGIIPLLAIPFINILNFNWIEISVVIILLGTIYLSVIPFFIILSNEEEFMW